MTVSLCIVAYNEEKSLGSLLGQVRAQSYPAEKTELVLVDSVSKDSTKNILLDFAVRNKDEYIDIQVLDNPRRNQAAGWNTAISNAVGEIIIRLDAHAEIPENFIEENVKLIMSGEYVCGGARPSKVDDPTPMKDMLFLAESSMFGSSIAGYRRKSGEKKYVSSVFHGAYRREVFEKVGGFNENLGRTEDNELHYRIRKAGYKICQGSKIVSYQHIRATLGAMLAQKYGNGKWIGLTLGVCPECISLFHLVPFYFALFFLCTMAMFVNALVTGRSWLMQPFLWMMAVYLFAAVMMSVLAVFSSPKKYPLQLLLPCVFFLLHFTYGWGTISGLVQMPFWLSRLKSREAKTGRSAQKEIDYVRECVINNTVSKTTEVEE